jgi:MinD-like ATPase involved in chromosome partitioning or flagellar assembly
VSGAGDPVPVLLAVTGRPYEAALLAALDRPGSPLRVSRRCLDVVDVLAAARSSTQTTPAAVAVVWAGLHRLDGGVLARLADVGVGVVVVVDGDEHRDPAWGASTVRAPVADDARKTGAFVAELTAAVLSLDDGSVGAAEPESGAAGRLVAVWGPCGAPGRTTVAVTVADELARLGVPTLLADADTYGPSVAQRLGVLDEASGIAAAVRAADVGTVDSSGLGDAARALPSGLSVLTGLTRADRWPELPGPALRRVWRAARSFAEVTVVDCGFCLEEDDELSYDAVVARRNAATLVTVAEADVLVVVGAADVVGVTRLLRGLHELADLGDRRPGAVPVDRRVVLNRARTTGRRADRRLGALAELAELDPAGSFADAAVVPDDSPSLARSVEAGRTLAEVAGRSPVREALGRLAAGLAGRRPA